LELYFAVPCSGRVLHTLNIRLFPEQVRYIVRHAEDEVLFIDRSLIATVWPIVSDLALSHIVVMDDGDGEIPDDPRIVDYEHLIADAEPADLLIDDENRAAAMCYTSGTTGDPKGVVYSHRSTVLHSLGAMLADTLAISERDTALPIVPMFHANAWGLPYSSVMAGSSLVFPGPHMSAAANRPAHGERARHGRGRRADDLDERTRGAAGPGPLGAALDRVRRLGRPAVALGGLS
jgi:fatty-acyl-CoA synthase